MALYFKIFPSAHHKIARLLYKPTRLGCVNEFSRGKPLLTWQRAACRMASKPPSGESRLPDTLWRPTSCSKASASPVRGSTWWKLKGGWQRSCRVGQGWRSLEGTVLTKGSTVLSTKEPKPGMEDDRQKRLLKSRRQASALLQVQREVA